MGNSEMWSIINICFWLIVASLVIFNLVGEAGTASRIGYQFIENNAFNVTSEDLVGRDIPGNQLINYIITSPSSYFTLEGNDMFMNEIIQSIDKNEIYHITYDIETGITDISRR